jgi:hypothetical protein
MHKWFRIAPRVAVRLFSVVVALLFLLNPASRAQVKPQLREIIDERRVIRLPHTTHPLATPAHDLGRVESSRPMQRMVLLLSPAPQQQESLLHFLDDLHNPSSSNYHHWLTPEQFGALFGPAEEDIQQVRDWLQKNAFQVASIARGKQWMEFSGTTQQVESAFHTEMHYYSVRGERHIANALDISIPEALAQVTRGVLSLHNFPKRPPHTSFERLQRDASGKLVRPWPNLTASGASGNVYYLAPGDFAAIYNTKPLLTGGNDGTSITIAIAGQSQIQVSDVHSFRQIFGLPQNDPNIIVSGPDPGFASVNDEEESALDVEWAGAAAPGATIDLVIAGTTDTTSGIDLAASYIVDNLQAPIVADTYGSCEASLGPQGNSFYNALWQQAAAEGLTVFVASGDDGAAGCDAANSDMPAANGFAVNGAASTPYNVAVGGTQFDDAGKESTYWNTGNDQNFASAKGYIPEAAWNEGCDPSQPASPTNCAFTGTANQPVRILAGAGGASSIYAKPSWQAGPGVPKDNARDLPDVSLAAASRHDAIVICTSANQTPCQSQSVSGQTQLSGLTIVGGTSASAPAMAGIMALVEQKNGAFQGQANYVFYKLAASKSCNSSNETNPTAQNNCVFYDITAGSNAVPCAGASPNCSSTTPGTNGFLNGQNAGAGYDLATGLGSVNAANLVAAWKSASFFPSSTVLLASTTAFSHGQPISISGTVQHTNGTGTPSGSIALKTDTNLAADVLALTNGAFSGTLNDLPGGQYNLSAHYAGDATFAASDSPVITLNVAPEPSSITLSVEATQNGVLAPLANGGTFPLGTTVGLRINVKGMSGNGNASGSVTLSDNGTPVGTYSLTADGSAFLWTGGTYSYEFPIGSHTLSVAYAGDNSFSPSSLPQAFSFSVGKGTPIVILGSNVPTATVGQQVAFHGIVSGSLQALATGTIQFTDNGSPIGPVIPLQPGGLFGTQAQASYIAGLSAGPHTIGANYDGTSDPNYTSVLYGDPVNEFPAQITVTPAAGQPTTTTVTASAPPINLGDTASFIVTVKPTSGPGGTVTLYDAVGPRSSPASIAGGTVTISIPWTQAGSATVYAVYAGDATYAASSSAPVSLKVNQCVPQVTLAAPSTTTPNQQVSLNVTVSGNPANVSLPFPTGLVQFWDSVNNSAPQLIGAKPLALGNGSVAVFSLRIPLPPGKHVITAQYTGDNNWAAAASNTANINSADFLISVLPNSIPIAGGSPGSATLTVTSLSGFSGNVTFTCGTGSTVPPFGYNCTFSPNPLPVTSNAVATATLNLTPSPAAAAAIKSASIAPRGNWWGLSAGTGLAAFVLLLLPGSRRREYAALGCALLCVVSFAIGCGGGGGGGGPVPTTTTLTASSNRVSQGTPVIFSISINSSQTPGGTVQLFDAGQPLGSAVTVQAGIASITSSGLPTGVHSITARYSGDANNQGSTSSTVNMVITGNVPLQITAASGSGISHTADLTVTIQ